MDVLPATLSSPSQSPVAGAPAPKAEVATTNGRASEVVSLGRLDSLRPLTYLAVLTVAAVWVARLIAPALRGWRSGVTALLGWADATASVLSQLLAVVGVMFVTRILLRAFSIEVLGALQKLVLLPAGFAVLALVVIASQAPLDPTLAMSVASAAGFAALSAAPSGLRYPGTRAAALTVTAVAVASLLQALARRLALEASADALTQLYVTARVLATVATVIMSGATILGFLWLSHGRARGFWVELALFITLLAVVGWSTSAGSAPDASSWQVLISRATQQLDRHPRPLLAPIVLAVALAAPLLAATTALASTRDRALRASVALALVAGLHTDLAPLAMALLSASAIIALEVALGAKRDHGTERGAKRDHGAERGAKRDHGAAK